MTDTTPLDGRAATWTDRLAGQPNLASRFGRTWWRWALMVSGLLLVIGPSLHPSRVNNSAKHDWASRELLVLAGAVLLVAGLEGLRRQRVPASDSRGFAVATFGVALFCIEVILHLFPYTDTDQLGTTDLFAPIGFLHLMLAVVIYPISGVAISYLAYMAARLCFSPSRWVLAGGGAIGGLLHALSMPVAVFTSIDTGPMFTAATTLIAVWTLATAMTSRPTPPVDAPRVSESSPHSGRTNQSLNINLAVGQRVGVAVHRPSFLLATDEPYIVV